MQPRPSLAAPLGGKMVHCALHTIVCAQRTAASSTSRRAKASSGHQTPSRRLPSAPSCVWRHKQWWRQPARRAGPRQAPPALQPALAARPGAPQVRGRAFHTSRRAMRMLARTAVVAGRAGGGSPAAVARSCAHPLPAGPSPASSFIPRSIPSPSSSQAAAAAAGPPWSLRSSGSIGGTPNGCRHRQ